MPKLPWSVKDSFARISRDIDYDSLPGVKPGTMTVSGYFAPPPNAILIREEEGEPRLPFEVGVVGKFIADTGTTITYRVIRICGEDIWAVPIEDEEQD